MKCGNYEILDQIGQGGMGTVYRAQAPDGTVVALKTLHAHLGMIEEFVKRFHREAKLAGKLAHPNVVRVLDDGVDGSTHYMVMEYVEGRTLTELMHDAGIVTAHARGSSAAAGAGGEGGGGAGSQRTSLQPRKVAGGGTPGSDATGGLAPPERCSEATSPPPPSFSSSPAAAAADGGGGVSGALPPAQVIAWMRQIAGVLQAASDIGLVHRDLKPQNILIDAKGNAKVLDFGLAKDTAALSSVLSHTGQSLGTPPYMSPEQCEGTKEIDTRSDLYSLGATAYHLLTGHAPFPGPTQSAYIRQHLEEIPEPACKANPDVPRNLSWVLDRLLAKDPAKRHGTAAELIEDLNRVERGERPLGRYKPKRMRKHKAWHTAAAVAVAAILVAGAFGGWLAWRGANADGMIAERISSAQFAADQGQLDEALTELDAVIAAWGDERPDLVEPAAALRDRLRDRKSAAERERLAKRAALVGQGDERMGGDDYAAALALYQQAAALGGTDEIAAKVAAAEQAVERLRAAEAERARRLREEAERKRAAAEAERERRFAYETAVTDLKRFLGDGSEDTLVQAEEAWNKARQLARSAEETAPLDELRGHLDEALKNRRPWAAVVDFDVGRSVKAELSGRAVAVKLEQALSGRYRLVTRAQISKALEELRLQSSDLADRTKAKRFGKMVGAEYLVTGSVVQIGREITIAAQTFAIETGAIRQTAEVMTADVNEFNSLFREIAAILDMDNAEKQAYMNERYNYPRHVADGRAAGKRGDWAEAVKAFERAARAKSTAEVRGLLAEARTKAEEQRLLAEREALYREKLAAGRLALRREQWDAAETAFAAALQVPGYTADTEAKAGLSAARGGAAEADRLRAIKAALDSAATLADRARTVADWQKAAEALARIEDRQPERGPYAAAHRELLERINSHLRPMLRLEATLDGRALDNPTVTLEPSAQKQGDLYLLDENRRYTLSVTRPARGKTHYTTWTDRFRADWRGTKTAKAEVEEVTDPTANNVLGMAFVEIAPGPFKMGSNDGDEKPPHDVRISHRFWMGKFEVTQAEYEKLTGKNPSHFKGARNPVEQVSWNDAKAFCEELTERERRAGRLLDGYVYRLPTEAEWEYAARGGNKSRGFKYSGSNNPTDVAWYSDNSGSKTHEVGQLKANELGLHDMSGNVWEWCYDWYDSGYYGKSPGTDPVNTNAASYRVSRGGSWHDSSRFVRSANRDWDRPGDSYGNLGFRVCLAPQIRE